MFAGPSKQARRSGALETIVLDDIELMPACTRARLAGILEEGLTAGGPRIVALSTRSAVELAQSPAMFLGLWLALAALAVQMPALDDYPAHRLAAVNAPLPTVAECLGIVQAELTAGARAQLAGSDWPGNIAQMRAVLTAVLAARTDATPVTAAQLRVQQDRIAVRTSAPTAAGEGFDGWLNDALAHGGFAIEQIERSIYDAAVARTDGNLSAAARLLGLTRAQLSYRLGAGRDKGGTDT